MSRTSALVENASPSTSADATAPTLCADFSSSSVNSQQNFEAKYASSALSHYRCNLRREKRNKHSSRSQMGNSYCEKRHISWTIVPTLLLLLVVIPLYTTNIFALAIVQSTDTNFNSSSLSAKSTEATPFISHESIDFKSKARLNALKHIQRSLEHYSLFTAETLLKKAVESATDTNLGRVPHTHRFSDADAENAADFVSVKNARQTNASTSAFANFMRVRVGIREQNRDERNASRATNDFNSVELLNNNLGSSSNNNKLIELKLLRNNNNSNDNANNSDVVLGKSASASLASDDADDNNADNDEDEDDNSSEDNAARRRLRSASTRFAYSKLHRHRHQTGQLQHRRRRKGCPPMHGKDQLLCPSRNAHRYDVCVTREQLCNHVQDCPNGEDEDPAQCFFYKPLDDQLKTLSHAVLLLVESVMSEQQQRQRAKTRAEDL